MKIIMMASTLIANSHAPKSFFNLIQIIQIDIEGEIFNIFFQQLNK
jgi:hypothetical protein